jgi:hypothetical protein
MAACIAISQPKWHEWPLLVRREEAAGHRDARKHKLPEQLAGNDLPHLHGSRG